MMAAPACSLYQWNICTRYGIVFVSVILVGISYGVKVSYSASKKGAAMIYFEDDQGPDTAGGGGND